MSSTLVFNVAGANVPTFANMTAFEAAGGAASNPGPVWIGGKSYTSDGVKYLKDASGEYYTTAVGDIEPTYDINLTNLAASVVRNNATMTVGGSRATNTNFGTRIEWDNGLNHTDSNTYISIAYEFPTAVDLSSLDRFMFEFLHTGNWMHTRLRICVSSVTGQITGSSPSSNVLYSANRKPPAEALLLRKADFSVFQAGGVDWASVKRIEFRLEKHAGLNPNLRADCELRRVTIGAKTKPMILLTQDDNHANLYAAHVRNADKNLKFDVFCTDFEIPTSSNFESARSTLVQCQEMAAAGYNFYPHNIDHRAYSQVILSYTRVGDTVTLTIGGFGGAYLVTVNSSLLALPQVGEYIYIDGAIAEQLNGKWAVQSITPGTATTNTTLTITVPGASFSDDTTSATASLTVDRYNFIEDFEKLKAVIKMSGLPTSDRYMAYTYGRSSKYVRDKLTVKGVVLARAVKSTEVNEFYSTYNIFQINRRWGVGGGSERLLTIPTHTVDNNSATTLVPIIDRLIEVGGVISIFLHGDEAGLTSTGIDNLYAMLAAYRDSGQVDLVNMAELEAEIKARQPAKKN